MEKTRIKKTYKPSNKPYIVTGVLWAILAFILPVYKLSSILIITAICIVAYIIMRKLHFFKDIEIATEEKVSYADMNVDEVIDTGKSYIHQFDMKKQRIHNVDVRRDLDSIISICNQIFDEVKRDPKDVKKIRKLISYYLPMIDKMLTSYISYEKDNTSESVQESKTKIENMLKTVINAFKSLYDSLHEEEAIDISSDIKVMENMMAQEGYLEK